MSLVQTGAIMGFPQASNHNGFSGLYCTTIALLRSNSFTKCFLKARCLFPIETLQMFLHDPLRSSQSSTVMSGVRLASSSFHIQRIPAKKQTIETCGRSSLTFLSCLPKVMLSSTCCELLKLSTTFAHETKSLKPHGRLEVLNCAMSCRQKCTSFRILGPGVLQSQLVACTTPVLGLVWRTATHRAGGAELAHGAPAMILGGKRGHRLDDLKTPG